jgi:Fe-S oxidoreductase
VTQHSWKNLLDLYTCTECGRCQEQCPAFLTGKPLNPKMIIVDSRENLFKTVRDAPADQRRAPQQAQALIGAGEDLVDDVHERDPEGLERAIPLAVPVRVRNEEDAQVLTEPARRPCTK